MSSTVCEPPNRSSTSRPRVRPRVLLIAEACNPDWQSVPLEGYNLYRALTRQADVTLVTQVRNRDALRRRAEPGDRSVFINSELISAPFYQLSRLLTLGRGLGWTTKQAVMLPPYLYFEYLVYNRFSRALARGEFDLIHRLTPLSPTYPSPIAGWSDVPFVMGPLNGGLPWPKGTTRVRWAEMEWMSYFRRIHRLLPFHRRMLKRAAVIIAGSTYTQSELPPEVQPKTVYIPENGIEPGRFHAGGRTPPSRISPFRILFVGRLVPYKGADLVIEAIAASTAVRGKSELTIVGGGPQRKELEQLAEFHGLAERVRFTGQIPQAETVRHFQESSVFCFPSLREFGGAVVVEAMACGLPSIVLDYGGPGEHVTDATGVRIPLTERPRMIAAIRTALEGLLADRQRLDQMSQAGLERVRRLYTWDAKAALIRSVYEKVIAPPVLSPSRRAHVPALDRGYCSVAPIS